VGGDTAPTLIAIPEAGETLRAAQERGLAKHLELHPDSPKSLHGYSWIEIEIVSPPPIIEPQSAQWGPPFAEAPMSELPFRAPSFPERRIFYRNNSHDGW
jgi:hypothetical protein